MTDTQSSTRRRILQSAAWSVPVIALATGVPVASASVDVGEVPNADANYYWDTAADTTFVRLDPASGDHAVTFSAQISYRADPWMNPPAGASLQIVVTFDRPVTYLGGLSTAWRMDAGDGGPRTTYVFTRTPASFGDGLSCNFRAAEAGRISVTAKMSVLDPGEATWAVEPGVDSAEVR